MSGSGLLLCKLIPESHSAGRKSLVIHFGPVSLGRQMRRREFVKLLTGSAVAWPLAARAQQTSEIPKSWFCISRLPSGDGLRIEAILSGLRVSGYAAPAQVEIVAPSRGR